VPRPVCCSARLTEKSSRHRREAGRRPGGFFLYVEDFRAAYVRMASAAVQFLTLTAHRASIEPYGHVAAFLGIVDNKWDLIGPVLQDRQLAPATYKIEVAR
jgi:hypothetical protein